MNAKMISTGYRLAQWAQIIKERSESGLSIRAFCTNNDINEKSYYYWLRKLREKTCEAAKKTTVEKTELMPYGFTEVKLVEPATASAPLVIPEYHINIEARGVRLSANSDYPADKLVKLLREVVRSC